MVVEATVRPKPVHVAAPETQKECDNCGVVDLGRDTQPSSTLSRSGSGLGLTRNRTMKMTLMGTYTPVTPQTPTTEKFIEMAA